MDKKKCTPDAGAVARIEQVADTVVAWLGDPEVWNVFAERFTRTNNQTDPVRKKAVDILVGVTTVIEWGLKETDATLLPRFDDLVTMFMAAHCADNNLPREAGPDSSPGDRNG